MVAHQGKFTVGLVLRASARSFGRVCLFWKLVKVGGAMAVQKFCNLLSKM